MTNIPLFQVDAFVTDRPLTGNPAAVMPLERWLDDVTLQAIAAENNLSETAFTVPSRRDDADYDLRWFTPIVEVDLCGHATLASGHVLLTGEQVRFSTRSGILIVKRQGDLLELDLPSRPPTPGELPGLTDALGAPGRTFLGPEGSGAVVLVLESEEAVRALEPDFTALRQIDALVIATAPGKEQEVASRVFAAAYGIDEDPVTGSAHAVLTPFWAQRLGRERFTAIQASQRGGLLECRLAGDRVILGGRCATTIVGTFQL